MQHAAITVEPIHPRLTVALVDADERARLAAALAAPGRPVDRALVARQAGAVADRRRDETDLVGAKREVTASMSAYMDAMQTVTRLRGEAEVDDSPVARQALDRAIATADDAAARLGAARRSHDKLRDSMRDDISRDDRLAALAVLSGTAPGRLVLDDAVVVSATSSSLLTAEDLEHHTIGPGEHEAIIVLTGDPALVRWANRLDRARVIDPADLWTVAGAMVGTGA